MIWFNVDRALPTSLFADIGCRWDVDVREEVETALARAETRRQGKGEMSDARAGALLTWALRSCTWAVRERDIKTLSLAMSALDLLDGHIGYADRYAVASVGRYVAANHFNYDGDDCPQLPNSRILGFPDWFERVEPRLPWRYIEIGSGKDIAIGPAVSLQ